MASELTIGQVAREAGVPASTIRYYEQIGLLPPSKRVNKQRRFDPVVLRWLTLIDFSQKAGFTLAEIQELFEGFEGHAAPSERFERMALQKLPEIDALIERAERMKRLLEIGLRCGCLTIEDCVILNGERETSPPDPLSIT